MSLTAEEHTDELVKNLVKSLTGLEVDTNICNKDYDAYVACFAGDKEDVTVANLSITNIPTDKESRTFLSDFTVEKEHSRLLQSITIHDGKGAIEDTLDELFKANFTTLFTMDIRAQGVTGSLPEEANVKKLRNLTVHGSLTGSVPEAYASVESMDLAGNQLDAFDASKFLELTHVNLSGNAITTLTNFWGTSVSPKKYVTVDFSGNKGEKTFPSDMNTPDLKFLNASGSDFKGKFFTKLPDSLGVLDVSNNKLTGSLSIPLLAQFINASHNGFTALHYEYSQVMPRIKRLDLSSNPNLEGSFFINKLSTPSLSVLNVSNVKSVKFIDLPEGVALPRFPSTLRVLDLTNAGLKGTIPEDAFVDCDRLERVELSSNNFEGCIPASWKDNAVLKATTLLNTMKYCGVDGEDSSSHIVDSSSYFDDSSFHDNDSSARSGSNGKTIGIAVGCSLGGVLLLVLLLVVLCCCFRSCCLTQCLIRFWNKVFCCCRCGVTEDGGNARYSLDGEEKSRESRAETVTNSSLTSADFAGFFVNENEDTDNNDAPYSIG